MKISGLLKFSMIDFPGSISAIVFTQGCNLHCAYCHNPELIPPAQDKNNAIAEEDILDYLNMRRKALDGLVITGGEPTLRPQLPRWMEEVRRMGYRIKLDTNGQRPNTVRRLAEAGLAPGDRVELLDFIAMDIKAPFEKYEAVCGKANLDAVKESMAMVISSGINYQFRTTYYKEVLNDGDIETIKTMVPDQSKFKLQECLPVKKKDVLKIEH